MQDHVVLANANNDLLSLGDGQLAYVKLLSERDLAELEIPDQQSDIWGVFSAKGEALAVCSDTSAAWSFAMESELIPVNLH